MLGTDPQRPEASLTPVPQASPSAGIARAEQRAASASPPGVMAQARVGASPQPAPGSPPEADRRAAGIAHDVNNLLGVILGYSELVADELAGDASPEARSDLLEIQAAARCATHLLDELSKLDAPAYEPAPRRRRALDAIVREAQGLIAGTLGRSVELEFAPGASNGEVCVGDGELENVLVNLAANARDAMPAGGHFRIETRPVWIERGASGLEARAADGTPLAPEPPPGTPPGAYLRVVVSDTGCGMDPCTLAAAFDPYFTTKGDGGTGLGLANARVVLERSDAVIHAISEPGCGTCFTIDWPAVSRPVC